MTHRTLILLAGSGSATLLGGAFIFQALGYAPCMMCLWQRWPHGAAILIAILALVVARTRPILTWIGAGAALITSALGLYHTGVERAWWDGPNACSGISTFDLSDPLSTDIQPIVMCTDVTWQFLGLSMASYNALFSALLVLIWVAAARAASIKHVG